MTAVKQGWFVARREMRERARLCRTQAVTSQQREARYALLKKAAEWEAWAAQQDRVEAQAAKLREH